MKRFIRDNLMIVVSIALPVVVVVLFALATVLPRLYVEPPAHNLVLAMDSRGIGGTQIPVGIELRVDGGALHAEIYQLERDARALRPAVVFQPRIFEYVATDDTVREISLELPENVTALPNGTEIPIPEFAGVHFITTLRAPDGYELELRRDGGGGLFRGLFGTGFRGMQPRISKNGAVVEIDLPLAEPYYYGNVRFIGWIADPEPR